MTWARTKNCGSGRHEGLIARGSPGQSQRGGRVATEGEPKISAGSPNLQELPRAPNAPTLPMVTCAPRRRWRAAVRRRGRSRNILGRETHQLWGGNSDRSFRRQTRPPAESCEGFCVVVLSVCSTRCVANQDHSIMSIEFATLMAMSPRGFSHPVNILSFAGWGRSVWSRGCRVRRGGIASRWAP